MMKYGFGHREDRYLRPPVLLGFIVGLVTILATGVWLVHGEQLPVKPLSEQKELREFLGCQVVPQLGNAWDYTFEPGEFPKLEWDGPEVVKKMMGEFPLKVRWFDEELREVTAAERPGRYAFYAEGRTPAGKVIRRGGTLFCRPKDWMGWNEKPKVHFDFLPLDGVTRKAWDRHQEAIDGFAGRTLLLSILRQREGAVLMSYLHEMRATGEKPALTDTPLIRDHEYHLALKRRILRVEGRYRPMRLPQRSAGTEAPVLRPGTEAESGFKPGTAVRLREICQEWFEESGEPFNLVVARRSVVILDESFGDWSWGELTRETPTEMASLTKLLTGILFAQFVDQSLIAIDDPVGKYLPDFPATGDNVLTLRHCFTHATALYGHEEWGGMHNPWLENVIANASEHLLPGRTHNYNGIGYDLAGKVMEIVSGKSIFRLMRENFFGPLGLEHTTLEEDLGFSCFSTAADFAVIGQLLLNRGAYGELAFFSPKVFEQLLPQPLSRYYPGLDEEWGIGITWMRQSHPGAGKNGVPSDATILSRNTIGHGSATAAILRVDLNNELVISQTRRRAGSDYDKHLLKFLIALEEGL
jgi:hypothetical protein